MQPIIWPWSGFGAKPALHLRSIIRLFALACSVVCAEQSLGQAWVPPKGEGEYSMVFQDLYTTKHTLGDGSRVDRGTVTLLGLVNTLDFGVTDKFAVTLAVPAGMGKYDGKYPHLYPIDNGNFHGSLQDMGIGLRYNVASRPLMLTPFVLATYPMMHYEHFAHSAVGGDAWEVRMGFSVGHYFETGIPNAYFQVQYSYSIAQAFMGIRPDRNRFNGEFGYSLGRRVQIRALALSQVMTMGLNIPKDYPDPTPGNPLFRQHDRISQVDFFMIGGGVSYSLTHRFDVFGSLLTMPWGTNGHAVKTGLAVGVSWSFRTPWARPEMVMQAAPPTDSWEAHGKPPLMQCPH